MEDHDGLPEALKKAAPSLQPFVKPRQEVAQIRRILSSHLSGHLNSNGGLPVSRPLSLVDPKSNVDVIPHGVRGIQREYLRCVRANIKARQEYSKASREHRAGLQSQGPIVDMRECSTSQDGFENSMESFLALVRQRQKHERLRIIQDYIDMLSQKPAASAEHLNLQEVLKGLELMPKVPAEVVNVSASSHMPDRTDLKVLMDQLEKSVLRAKMLLKKEQNLLAKLQAKSAIAPIYHGGRLQAIDATRHDLIDWIEVELGRAGDSPLETEDEHPSAKPAKQRRDHIESELRSIQRQYARYTKDRQGLVTVASGKMELPTSIELDENNGLQLANETLNVADGTNRVIHPYLEAMVLVSNEQKMMIQQKSHLTITLSKQLKEGSQGLDRLAEESHLLPAHPMLAVISQRKALEGAGSFGEQMSNQEWPDTSRRARAWVFASDSATNATKDMVSEKLDEGSTYVVEAEKALSELKSLLRIDGKEDMWARLDGNLGGIRRKVADH
jgi:hypothetical protein